MREDGEMARVPDLEKFCQQHNMLMCSVAQIVEHRLARESLVKRIGPREGRPVRTAFGEFRAHLYQSVVDPLPHVALTMGEDLVPRPSGAGVSSRPTLVRMHRRSLLGDVFMDLDSTSDGASGAVLHDSMRLIAREGRGAIVYLRTTNTAPAGASDDAGPPDLEGALQTMHADHAKADRADLQARAQAASVMPLREYGVGCQILRDLGLSKLRLITNSSRSVPGIEHFGLEIVERVASRV
jgi:3,4-dihydroxy 2-butanone 4-phosphate synthase/GTP cyclohydrolase II